MPKVLTKVVLPFAALLFAAGPKLWGDAWDKKTDITIDRPIEVPGVVLLPGTYTFKLLNSTDRHIVEITSTDGKQVYAIVFTAAARRLQPTGEPVMTFFETTAGRPETVHRWFWPGDLDGQEFLYPHKQAVTIAKETGVKVPEAPVEVVEETEVVAEVAPEPAPTPPPAVAEVETPQEVIDALPAEQAPAPATAVAEAPPNVYELPSTATDLPLIGLLGLGFVAVAALIRVRRQTA